MSVKLPFSRVTVLGSGLIGTSIGLALAQRGVKVRMQDSNPQSEFLAQQLVGVCDLEVPDLIVVAVPISEFSHVLTGLETSSVKLGIIDVASVKTKAKEDVESSAFESSKFLPSHPMAGREVGGAESARADLFEGRPWIIDSSGVDLNLLSAGQALITALGSHIVDMPAAEHDKAVALVSHLPQLVSSLLAKQLPGAKPQWLELAGGGLRDTTRIAASDPVLWSQIVSVNSEAISPLLKSLHADLTTLISDLANSEKIFEFVESGRKGREAIPGKHGGKARDYTYLPIVIEDKPGQLAAIFNECAQVKVNIEDLSIEHSPGQETGLITLAVSSDDAAVLGKHLSAKGWSVHTARS